MTLSERVTVLQDGRYLGPNRKAVTAAAGDVVEVLGGWYAAALVEDGLADYAPNTQAPAAIGEAGELPERPATGPDMTVPPDLPAAARPRKPAAKGSRA